MFYLKNNTGCPLLGFSGSVIDIEPEKWTWGSSDDEKSRIEPLVQAIRLLKAGGVNGYGVVGRFHRRRVLPLMRRVRLLHEMTLGASTVGTAMSVEALDDDEVQR